MTDGMERAVDMIRTMVRQRYNVYLNEPICFDIVKALAALPLVGVEREGVARALKTLIDKLDFVHTDKRYKSVWTVSQVHVGPYTGPTYTAELEVARSVLALSKHTGQPQAGCAKDARDAFNAVDGYLNSKETSPGTFKELWEALRTALSASPPLPVAEREWQPIETAPLDDSEIWISNGKTVWLGTAHKDGSLKLPSRSECKFWMPAHKPAPPLLAEQGEKS